MKNFKYKSFPKLNDHGSSCIRHANWMLDCTYEKEEDREVLDKCIANYLPK